MFSRKLLEDNSPIKNIFFGMRSKIEVLTNIVIIDSKIQFCEEIALGVWLDSCEVIALHLPNFSQKFQVNSFLLVL